MAHAHRRALGVVHHDGVDLQAGRQAVQADQGSARVNHLLQVCRLAAVGRYDRQHAVNPPDSQHGEHRLLALHMVVRIENVQQVSPLDGRILRASNHQREKGIRDIGDHHPEGLGLAGFQAAGNMVRLVTKLPRGSLNPFTQGGADRHRSAHDIGNGAYRYASALGDFLDRGHVNSR